MSTLTHWRRQANRYGRDLVRVTPGGKIGLLVVGGLGALFGYRRYYQPKIGDQVEVNIAGLGLPIPPGAPTTATGKVAALNPDGSLVVQFIAGGVLAPSGATVPSTAILKNLTPRLF